MPPYRYTTLTKAIDDKNSPLRKYLDQRFANARPLQAEYRSSRSPPRRRRGGQLRNPRHAFDLQMCLRLDPTTSPVVLTPAFPARTDQAAVTMEVRRLAQSAAQGEDDYKTLGRACWVLGLCAEFSRADRELAGSPLTALIDGNRFDTETLLDLAPQDGLRQLRELDASASEKLLPHLSWPLRLGPTVDGSKLCRADADLIADGLLLDLMTHLGAKNKRTGVRSDGLALVVLYQVLAYALFDRSDTYTISRLGIYSARYGNFVVWPLIEAMETLADSPVDLAEERARVWTMLGG